MKHSYTILVVLILSFSFSGFSQEFDDKENSVLLTNELSYGLSLETNGFEAMFRRGKNITSKKLSVYEISISKIKHPKEFKIINESFPEFTRGYFYGKMNSFFNINYAFGRQKIHFTKETKNSVQIRSTYLIGVSLGFSKPVYLKIKQNTYSFGIDYKEERYNPDIHDQNNILERSSFYTGFSSMKLKPGIHAKYGLGFEYGNNSNNTKSLETGMILDAYPQRITIMAENSQNLFFSLYLNFTFGSRWY